MNYLIPRCELEDPRHIPYVESPFMAACHVTLYVNGCFTHDLVRCPVNILPMNRKAAYAAIAKRYGENEWASVKVDGKHLNYHDYYGTAYEDERSRQNPTNGNHDGGDGFNRSLP